MSAADAPRSTPRAGCASCGQPLLKNYYAPDDWYCAMDGCAMQYKQQPVPPTSAPAATPDDPRSNGTTIGHEPDVLPQGMTFHAGELGDAYVAGAKSGRDHQPTDEQIERACDAYVKHIHLRRMEEAAARSATPTGADDAE